jgi:hypothetical protein
MSRLNMILLLRFEATVLDAMKLIYMLMIDQISWHVVGDVLQVHYNCIAVSLLENLAEPARRITCRQKSSGLSRHDSARFGVRPRYS